MQEELDFSSASSPSVPESSYLKHKPWLNAEVRALLKAGDAAFRTGKVSALWEARKELASGIVRTKTTYGQKIKGHSTTKDSQRMWKGVNCITSYNIRDAQRPTDLPLPDALNTFYAHFEDPNTSTPDLNHHLVRYPSV